MKTAAPRALVLGSDHAGRALRTALAPWLRASGYDVAELGPTDPQARVDYPDCAAAACAQLLAGRAELGILVCGSGIGVSLAANAHPGLRAAVCTNEWMARMARAHNDVNVLCLGERMLGHELARAIVGAFLATPFEGGRHAGRLAKLSQLRSRP